MAVAIVSLGTAVSNTDSTTYTLTVTPEDDSVIFLHVAGRDDTAPTAPTITDDTSGSWTALAQLTIDTSRQRIYRRTISGTSPGSTIITATWGATINASAMGALSATGINLTTPVVTGSSKSATGTGTAVAPGTTPSLADASNGQILFVSNDAGTTTVSPEAGWTERYDVTTSDGIGVAAYIRIASEDTSPTATISGSTDWMATALEVAVASATGQPTLMRLRGVPGARLGGQSQGRGW